jgi:hypothetical protein
MPKPPAKAKLPVHPLIASLKHSDEPAKAPVKFTGYIGVPGKVGMLRLYSSLDDLSHYVEFDEGAVLQTAAAPENVLPDNAVHVWVDPTTPVRYVREYSSARRLLRAIQGNMNQFRGTGGK